MQSERLTEKREQLSLNLEEGEAPLEELHLKLEELLDKRMTIDEILALPSIERQMVREGADPAGGTPAAFRQFVQREYEKWKVIVRESGATSE